MQAVDQVQTTTSSGLFCPAKHLKLNSSSGAVSSVMTTSSLHENCNISCLDLLATLCADPENASAPGVGTGNASGRKIGLAERQQLMTNRDLEDDEATNHRVVDSASNASANPTVMLSQLAIDPSLSLEHQDGIFAVAYIHVEAEAAFQAQYVCALALASAATDDVSLCRPESALVAYWLLVFSWAQLIFFWERLQSKAQVKH
jgi:hypothetical protein